MVRLGYGTSLFVTLALGQLTPSMAFAQGNQVAPIKVNLPPPPNFDVATAPVQYPSGEMSVYGLRKQMSKYLDKDIRVKAYLLEIYECPAEIRKCNDEAAAKAKREKRSKKAAAEPAPAADKGACRPCDQPHFFIGDTAETKIERGMLVADYPVKDWKTNKPKPLVAPAKQQYIITGTFAINSITGFAASNGLIIHKKMEDMQGKVLAEGNAVLPPEAQTIQLEGKPPQPVGAATVPPKK